MRVLVCGGRRYDDWAEVFRRLDELRPKSIIQGDATGADAIAVSWARTRGVPYTTIAARWREFGAAAGAIRNQAMLDHCNPDLVLAFPGGSGTADMIRRAESAGVKVQRVAKKL